MFPNPVVDFLTAFYIFQLSQSLFGFIRQHPRGSLAPTLALALSIGSLLAVHDPEHHREHPHTENSRATVVEFRIAHRPQRPDIH